MFKRKNKNLSSQNSQNIDLEGINPDIYAKRWWILVTLCISLLAVMLANSSLNMAMPSMQVDLGLSQLDMTWIINIYTLIFASLLFIAGAFGDRYGRRLALYIGLAIFFFGSLYAGFIAQTSVELIISRLIMGVGGALVMPTTLSIVNNVFPKNQRPKAIAVWSAISGIGMMFGNIISGFLITHFSWHSIFFFSALVAAISIIGTAITTPESKDEKQTPIDWVGGLFSALGLFGIVYGITEAPSAGIDDKLVLLGLIGGLISMALFIIWEKKQKHPMLDMNLFKNRNFSVATTTLILTFLAMSGVFFFLSQMNQLILGMDALQASFAMIPLMLPMMFFSPMVPSIVKKFGQKRTISIGLLIVSLTFLAMSTWNANVTYWHLLATISIMMMGISAVMAPSTEILISSVPRNRSGMGSAMNDTTRELGAALGIAILGATVSSVYSKNIQDIAAQFGNAAEGIKSSLSIAIEIFNKTTSADSLIYAARQAWMEALSQAALIAAIIILACAIFTAIALPKITDKISEK